MAAGQRLDGPHAHRFARGARVIVVMTESLLLAVWPTYNAEPAELAEHFLAKDLSGFCAF